MKRVLLLFFSFAILSCSGLPEIKNFHKDIWLSDPGGCQELRDKEVPTLMEQKDKIIGLSESQITKLLGRPDVTDLYLRTQKFMVYYISPGPACEGSNTSDRPDRLAIRISALGRANEVTYYQEDK